MDCELRFVGKGLVKRRDTNSDRVADSSKSAL